MKEKSLSSKIVFGRGEWGTKKIIRIEDVHETIKRILERINQLPNRDDSIMPSGKYKLKLGVLDGGGVGKFEVMNIIKEEVGKELGGAESEEEK